VTDNPGFNQTNFCKTIVIATMRGNVPVPGAEIIKLGLNCFKYAEKIQEQICLKSNQSMKINTN